MRVDLVATYAHYAAHMWPVWEALPDDMRGDVYLNRGIAHPVQMNYPGAPGALELRDAAGSTNLALCAGIADTRRSRGAAILMEHGCGQSYSGTRSAVNNSAFAGGSGRNGVTTFLSTNEQCAARDRARYPRARVDVIGSPYLEWLRATVPVRTVPNPKPVIAVAGHWPMGVSNEGLSAWGEFHHAFGQLAASDDYVVIGHGHPRIIGSLTRHYGRMGVEVVTDLPDVLARADLLIADNTSAMYFAAAFGIPVVVLDSRWYRRNVNHGLRFWDCADIGPRIGDPDALPAAVRTALTTRPWPGADDILTRVFPVDDAIAAAVESITATVANYQPRATTR